MGNHNIVSVSWGDHIVFGKGDGRLTTIDSVKRRMEKWRGDLDASILHWRHMWNHKRGRFYSAKGRKHPIKTKVPEITWDDFVTIPYLAHELGMKAYLYVSLFDEGWPLLPKHVREKSYHNEMHCKDVSWQSFFSRENKKYTIVDRTREIRQWGVLCLAYPEVRSYFIETYFDFISEYNFDGLFICFRSQSRPAGFADQFGFNSPIRKDFFERYDRDICKEDFDLQNWRDLCGEYITNFLHELRKKLEKVKIKLAVGVARGDVLGPPLGNTTLFWRKWIKERIVDELIINQNSSQCPSLWHQLWPMHRGFGYRQNYLDGYNMPALSDHIDSDYAPIFENSSKKLYVARMWDKRSREDEEKLLSKKSVYGLVFSSYRYDNPGPIAKGDWWA